MKIKLGLVLVVLLSQQSTQQTFAQANKKESYSINFGPEVAFPESYLRTSHKAGFGGSLKAEYTFGKHISATINTGILVFSGKNYFENISSLPTDYKSLIAIPIKVGTRYYLGSFYAAGEAGVVFLSKHLYETRPTVSLGIGDKIQIGYGKIDISLRQEFWLGNPENLNMAVLRVAYEIVW